MDVGHDCLCFLTIQSAILRQRFKSVPWEETRRTSKYGLQMMPVSSFPDKKSATAYRRESERVTDKFMSSGL